jgi:NAD(P)-dependent dehydrogenase (short-subunit alcohol dehydrogenase family)
MDVPGVKDLLDFQGKSVVVTGGGSGIGKGIVRRFSEAGADVVVHYFSSEGGAVDLVSEISHRGGAAIALPGDLSREEHVSSLFDRTIERFGRLDVLINNAGIYPLSSVLAMEPGQWDQVIATDLRSAHLCTQAAAIRMIAGGEGGSIVNVTSIEAENPAPNHSHYNAAKGGLLMYTRSAAFELGEYGIRVNAVAPGLIWKEGIEESWPDGVERYLRTAPLRRLGRPEDVADACLFLASPAARWITGASLLVDGGVMTHQIY